MLRDAMTEKQRGNTKQPPWQRDTDGESVPFGPWLRRQREMREITLREISDASKISLRYLQALEDERFDLLPAMVFAKGFLRQYARYVGLDQDEVVNRFLVARQGDEPDEEGEEDGEHDVSQRAGALEGTWKYVVLIIALAVVLLGLVFLIPHLFDGGDDAGASDPPPGVAPPQAGGPAATPAPEPEQAEPSDAVRISPERPLDLPDAPLRVTLDFREDCWVEATVDGERRVSEMRVQGESLQLQAQESVELRLGNAGVVAIEVNGRPYPLDARPGAVRRVRIDLSDLPGASPTTGEGAGEPGGTVGGGAAGSPS